MNRLFTSVTTMAIVAIIATSLPSTTSGFALLSPLLLRINPGAAFNARLNKSAPPTDLSIISQSKFSSVDNKSSSTKSTVSPISTLNVDFGHDEDLMRYKHELLSTVYEKSLTRGFE
jgi:hypothetical protein